MKAIQVLLLSVILCVGVPGCCVYRCASQGELPGSGCTVSCARNQILPERWCWGNCQVDEAGRATTLRPELNAHGQPLGEAN